MGNYYGIGVNELWINDGTGVFSAASGDIVSGSAETLAAAWADVDGDGDADLATAACPRPALPAMQQCRPHPSCSPARAGIAVRGQ